MGNQNRHLYSVGEICARTGVTRKTLFYYDKINLLKPAEREGSQRFKQYDQAQLERLQEIVLYRSAGLSISEIRRLLKASQQDKLPILEEARNRLLSVKQEKEEEIAKLNQLIEKEKNL